MHHSLSVRKKYYRFHHDRRHDIEECIQLKDEIKDLIHYGYLKKYVHRKEHHTKVGALRKSPTKAKIDNRPTRGRVNMISQEVRTEGAHGEANTLKRLRSNNIISFSNDDFQKI